MPKKEISNNKVKEVEVKKPKKVSTKSNVNTKKTSSTAKNVTPPKSKNNAKKEVSKIDKKVAEKKSKVIEKTTEIKETEATKKVKERTAKLAKAISNVEKKASSKVAKTAKTGSKIEKNVKSNNKKVESKLNIEKEKNNRKTESAVAKKTENKTNKKTVNSVEKNQVIKSTKKATTKVTKKTKEKLDEELKVVVKKENPKVDELTVIEKIKSFIAKIAAMQEEALKEENTLKEKKEKVKQGAERVKESKKATYMLEYYDLPYRYNETTVKILAQTPKVLFVYWDIADSDRNKYIETFGSDFFEKTYPVLLLYNEDKKYVKEVPINDFANSWYIDIEDSKTKYTIQLGRKFKGNDYNYVNSEKVQNANIILKNDYLPFASSNMLEVPNDHVLLESLPDFLIFRNVKTNQEFTKDIREIRNVYGNSYNIKDFYNDQYKEEISNGMFDMANPSSNLSSSSFK